MGRVTVDDAALALGRFRNGALANLEASRFALGHKNGMEIEVNGSKGSVMFNFEDMNHLSYFDATAPAKVRGWRRIMVTHAPDHPYAHAWWPDAHIVGYEHTFINQTFDMLLAMAGRKPTVPLADFEDAWKTQQVLEAAMISAAERCPVRPSDVK